LFIAIVHRYSTTGMDVAIVIHICRKFQFAFFCYLPQIFILQNTLVVQLFFLLSIYRTKLF